MTYIVVFSAAARRDMQRLSPRVVAAVVEFVYGDLASAPRRVGKPLGRELSGTFSARRGPYRVIFEIDDAATTVLVVKVGYRADVYRPR